MSAVLAMQLYVEELQQVNTQVTSYMGFDHVIVM